MDVKYPFQEEDGFSKDDLAGFLLEYSDHGNAEGGDMEFASADSTISGGQAVNALHPEVVALLERTSGGGTSLSFTEETTPAVAKPPFVAVGGSLSGIATVATMKAEPSASATRPVPPLPPSALSVGEDGAPPDPSPSRNSAVEATRNDRQGGARDNDPQPFPPQSKVTRGRPYRTLVPGVSGSATFNGPLAPYQGRPFRKQFSATRSSPNVRVKVRLDSANERMPCSRHRGEEPFHVLTPGGSQDVKFASEGFLVVKFNCTPKMCYGEEDGFRLLIDVTQDGSTQTYNWDFEFKKHQGSPTPKRRKVE